MNPSNFSDDLVSDDFIASLLPSYPDIERLWSRSNGRSVSVHEARQFTDTIVRLANTSSSQESELGDLCVTAGLARRASDGAIGAVTPETVIKLRHELQQRFVVDDSLQGLWCCPTVDAVLQWLQPRAERLGIKNIRYYPLSHDRWSGYSLSSYSSSGHDPEVTRRLRAGQIIKFLSGSQLQTADSFWVLALGLPSVFVIDDSCSTGVECYVPDDGIPLIRVARNHCMNVLARHNSDAWVDFPLSAGAASTGKLSCDLALPIELCHNTVARIAPPLRDAVLRFAGLVQVAAARLDVLYRQELQTSVPRQTDVGEMILQECDTPDALYRFCADRLPTLLQCRYGSILTRVRDSCGSDLLIFQRTSYVGSKHLQGVGTYHLEENTLTTWVARTGRSICLQDLGDRSLLQDKLREYDPNLKWANKIPDSDNHGDLLIVPVWYKQDVIAVLRYTARHDGHFTEREQRWLEQIARRHIGPRLDCTRRRLSEALRVAHYEEIAANSVRDAVTENDTGKEIAELFGATARKIFTQSGSGKTVLVNVIDEDRIHFRHYAILDELAGERLERYELAGSLTSMALSRPGVVYLADLEHAATMACYRSVFRDAVCALACKMGPAAQPTGVIVVLSDRFDISEDEHGPVLNLLAEHAGEILWRRELKSTLLKNWSRASGLKAVVRHLDQLLCKRESYTETAVPQLRPLLSLLNRMLDAVVPDGHKTESFTEEFDEFRVRDAIIVAASLARSETSESNLECHVDPDLNVVAQQGFFVAVMFDLLRYAWRFSRTAFIRARRRRSDGGAQWLEICIESFGKSRRIPAISGHSEAVLQSLRLEPRILELRGPYELARSYRLPDGRSGDVRVDTNEHDACYRCTFQLPIGADIPKPSMS